MIFFLGVPVKLGAGGAEEIIEFDADSQEYVALEAQPMPFGELCGHVDQMMKKTL